VAAADELDIGLLHRAAAGDRDAFGAIFERYQHVVYRFARAMTGSTEAADDVTQDVFVILMRDLARYSPERSALSTYLFGIARNVSRGRLRHDRRLAPLASVKETLSGRDVSPDPYEHLLHAETGGEIRRALGRLPITLREVIVLCDLHGLSYAEASVVQGTSVAAVRSRLHRGRHLLRMRLSRLQPVMPRSTSQASLRCPV
jgi:RNA polymerase sigma factor (sigma-70 family)